MLTELLGLAGSNVAGSIFGIVSDQLQARADRKKLEVELEIKRRANEAGQVLNHVQSVSSKPFFGFSFGVLVATYCACTIICFTFPDVIVYTLNPDDQPKKFGLLFGLINYEWQSTRVYTLSTGGVGYALLHPLAFQIGTVITGINASRR